MTPFRVLIFGYGFAGAWIHDPLIRSVPELQVSAVVTSNPDRRELAHSRDPDVKVFETADRAIADAQAEVAVIATPNRHHVELTLASLERGMAVVVDKPLANNAADARRLVAEAERLGGSLSVFHNRRWDGDYMTVMNLAAKGVLGPIHRLISRFDRWVPQPVAGWRDESPEAGGGLLLDLGSHLVDQAIGLLGPVESVYSELATLIPNRRSEDDVFISLQHGSGSVSHLYASGVEGAPSVRFHVSGSAGAYLKTGKDVQEERLLSGAVPVPGETGTEPDEMWGRIHRGEVSEPVPTIPGDWSIFYRRLVRHLRGQGPVPVSAGEATEVIEVLDAARISATEGVVVAIT